VAVCKYHKCAIYIASAADIDSTPLKEWFAALATPYIQFLSPSILEQLNQTG